MNVVNVYKQAAGFVYEFDFVIGTTSWSFTSQHSGKLVKAVLSNVASYKIGGATVIYPYQLSNGTNYAVSVIPTNSSLPCSVKFYADGSDSFSTTFNVTNYSAGDGQYLYILNSLGTKVFKVDTALLTPANSSGAGTWIVNPLIKTITLPTLPSSAFYTSITFVKNGGVNKMFIQGSIPNSFKVYASFIKCTDDTVWDIPITTQNSSTLIYNSVLVYNSGANTIYDFINEILYISTTSGGNGGNVLQYALNTGVSTPLGYSNFAYVALGSASSWIRPFQFIPTLQCWSWMADFSLITNKYYNYKSGQNGGSVASYQSSLGTTDRNNGLLLTKAFYDNGGAIISSITASGTLTTQYGATEVICLDTIGKVFTVYVKSFSIVDYKGTSHGVGDAQFLESGATLLKSVMGSNYSLGYYALSSGTSSKRLLVFNTNQIPVQFAYLDLGENCAQMHANQLII